MSEVGQGIMGLSLTYREIGIGLHICKLFTSARALCPQTQINVFFHFRQKNLRIGKVEKQNQQ